MNKSQAFISNKNTIGKDLENAEAHHPTLILSFATCSLHEETLMQILQESKTQGYKTLRRIDKLTKDYQKNLRSFVK